MSSRDRPLYRYFSVTSIEYKLGLDRIYGTRHTHYCFAFTVSIGSPRLDFDEFRRGQSRYQHFAARYHNRHVPVQLPQQPVLLGLPGRGLQRPQ